MEKSHKIYNLIFDFLLAAGVCFYNDLRFMRVWFLGGQLYHSVGFTNYRFGLTGKEVCWDFSPLNILHCLQGYDPHAYLRPFLGHDGLGAAGQCLVNLLGDERHKGMQQLERVKAKAVL